MRPWGSGASSSVWTLNARRLAVAALFFIAAILTKESGFLFPFTAAVLFAVSRSKGVWSRSGLVLCSGLAGFAIALQLSLNRSLGELGSNNLVYGADFGERLLLGFSILGKGSLMLIAPHRLAPSHGYAEVDLEWVTLLPHAVLGIAAAVTFVWEIRGSRLEKEKVIAAALVLWMAPIALQSGLLVTVQTDFAERLLYTASIPAVIWLAISLGNIPGSIKTTLLCFILLLSLSFQYPILEHGRVMKPCGSGRWKFDPWPSVPRKISAPFAFSRSESMTGCGTSWLEPTCEWSSRTHLPPIESPLCRNGSRKRNGSFEGWELTFPDPPCALIDETSERLKRRSPQLARAVRAEMLRANPICSAP